MSENNMAPLTVRIPETLKREAKISAAVNGELLQDWIRKAVEDRLRHTKEQPAAE